MFVEFEKLKKQKQNVYIKNKNVYLYLENKNFFVALSKFV